MGTELSTFDEIEIEKNKFYRSYFLAVISLESSLKKDENYYPQVFLKVCKCI